MRLQKCMMPHMQWCNVRANNIHWLKHMSSNRIRVKTHENREHNCLRQWEWEHFGISWRVAALTPKAREWHWRRVNPSESETLQIQSFTSPHRSRCFLTCLLKLGLIFSRAQIHWNDAIYLFGGFSINNATSCLVWCKSTIYTQYIPHTVHRSHHRWVTSTEGNFRFVAEKETH